MGNESDTLHEALWPFSTDAAATLNLVCFACAGGAASMFRSWPQTPASVNKFAVQLKGRGSRVRQQPEVRMQPIVDELVEAVQCLPDLPTVFFGHSMGAWVAYELIRALRHQSLSCPEHLIISGSLPITLNRLPPLVHKMNSCELREELRVLGGTPMSVLENDDLLAHYRPAIQADFEVFETHVHRHRTALDLDMSLWAAVDDPRIPIDAVGQWRQLFCADIRDSFFTGGHMFYDRPEAQAETSSLLNAVLAGVLSAHQAMTEEGNRVGRRSTA